jgi:hypothetical protein
VLRLSTLDAALARPASALMHTDDAVSITEERSGAATSWDFQNSGKAVSAFQVFGQCEQHRRLK